MVDTIIYNQAYKTGQIIASLVIIFVALGVAVYKLKQKEKELLTTQEQ